MLCSFLLSPIAQADSFEQPNSAEQVFPLENVGLSARANAMGEAFVAVPEGLDAMDFNPAAIVSCDGPGWALHHQTWFGSLHRESLSYQHPLGPWGLGGSLRYLGYGTLTARDEAGEPIGSYHPYRLGGSLTAGRAWKAFFFGATARYTREVIDGAIFQSLGGDLGVLWRPSPRLSAGFAYSQFGTDVRTYLTPESYRSGLSYSLAQSHAVSVRASVEYDWEPLGVPRLHWGAEGLFNNRFALRGGYSFDLVRNSLQGFHGLSTGMGFRAGDLWLDYAYLPQGDLGQSHQVSLRFNPSGRSHAAAATPTPQLIPVSTPVHISAFPTPAVPSSTPLVSYPSPTISPIPVSPINTPTATTTFQAPTVPPPTPTVPYANPTTSPTSTPKKETTAFGMEVYSTSTAFHPESGPSTDPKELKRLQKAIEEAPQNPDPWLDLGRLYWSTGDKEQAVQCFDQVLRLKPDFQALQDWLSRYRALTPVSPRE